MPKTSPLRGALLSRLPPRLLNAVFPSLRLAAQLLCLLTHPARALLLRLRAAAAPPPPPPLATGVVTHVGTAWRSMPKCSVAAAFVTPLGLLGDRQRSDWIAGFGGHGGLDKAGKRCAWRQAALVALLRRRSEGQRVRCC
jgi:hypothetical protein